jgi:hypothetical protein
MANQHVRTQLTCSWLHQAPVPPDDTPRSEQDLPVHVPKNCFSKLQTLSTCASLS